MRRTSNLPASRRGAPLPEPVFAQPVFAQQTEPSAPTLALLRVEPPVVVEKAAQCSGRRDCRAGGAVPEAVPVPPVETERLAALRVDEPTPPEPVKPETTAEAEPAPAAEAAAVEAAPAAAEEIKVAAVEQAVSPAATEAAPATPEP